VKLTRFRSIAERPSPLWVWGAGLVLTIAFLGALEACQTTPAQQTTIAQLSVAEACDAYAGALNVLAPQRAMGKLSVQEVARINDLNASVDPICSAKTPPADVDAAITQVSSAVTQAMFIFDSHKGG